VAPQVVVLVAAAGSFAALSFIFTSPLIAAVILIEAIGLGGPRLTLVLLPGLLAAGIGTLISIGMGSWTGLSTSAYALGSLSLPSFARPDIAQFGWTIALALGIAAVTVMIVRGGRLTERLVARRLLLLLPLVGLIVAGLAIAFSQASGKGVDEVLFSGQSALPGLVANAGTWSLSALALLIAFKGLAYALSLGSFRGGPTFPALFLGAAAGIMAGRLPGFSITPAVAVGMGAAFVAVLRLPLSAVVVATLLTSKAGAGAEPLIIVGVVVAYVVTTLLSGPRTAEHAPSNGHETTASQAPAPAVASASPDS
jgi:H+/Cl- antiporter ClcA